MRVLITGAGGLIGRELTGCLAERGHGVLALQRRASALRRNDGRQISAALWSGAPPAPGSVSLLLGDVRQPGLGLPGGLAHGLDLIIHCAALTGFGLDVAAYEEVNVHGTANVLASAGQVPVLHVSTAYVCGRRSGAIAEGDSDAGHGFHNGYERSKAAAEALVAAAVAAGRAVAVARPSIVVGASGTGAIGAFGGVYGLIRLVAEGRISTIPATSDASLNLVPIDHVAGGLADIAERMPAAAGHTFHLVSPKPVALTTLAGLANEFPGLHAAAFAPPEQFDPGALTPAQQHLHRQFTGPLAGYLQRSPDFRDDGLQALSGRRCPATGRAFLHGLISYCLRSGYITPRKWLAVA